MASRTRQDAERRGRRAEQLAAIWLRLKGYSILDMRVKTQLGEIDIIALRKDTLAFVEVKQRPTIEQAQNAVTTRNWYRVSRAAEYWASQRNNFQNKSWRYDLVAIAPLRAPAHFQDYWRP